MRVWWQVVVVTQWWRCQGWAHPSMKPPGRRVWKRVPRTGAGRPVGGRWTTTTTGMVVGNEGSVGPTMYRRGIRRMMATVERAESTEVETVFDLHRLRLVVARMGLVASEAELSRLMDRIDGDDDGIISFSEFVDFVTQSGAEDDAESLVGRLREALRDNTRYVAASNASSVSSSSEEGVLAAVAESATLSKMVNAEMERRRLDASALLSEFRELSRVQHESRVVVGGFRSSYTTASRTGYDARDWLRVLATWPSSFVVRRIRFPLVSISAWALVVAVAHHALAGTPFVENAFALFGASAASLGVARTMTLAGSALSLLLVFRTNTAYKRYAEARKVWTAICASARDCADFCAAYVDEMSEPRVRRVADLLCAFPLTLILYLQGQPVPTNPRAELERHFDALVKRARQRTAKKRLFRGRLNKFISTKNKSASSSSSSSSSKNKSSSSSPRRQKGKQEQEVVGKLPSRVRRRRRRAKRILHPHHGGFFYVKPRSSRSDNHVGENIPKSLVDNARSRSRKRRSSLAMAHADGRAVSLDAFVAICHTDDRLAATFSLPSDVAPDVALAQLHELKFGTRRPVDKPVSLAELEAYYNPAALARLLSPSDRARLARSRCPPLEIARQLVREAKAVPYDEILFTSRERMFFLKIIADLRRCVGSAERIAQTPVPLHYARHALRFLSLWALALPFALVDQLGLLAVPATTLIVWALFGLREIGTLIENPFTRPLQLQIVSDTLNIDVREAIDGIEGIDRQRLGRV